MNKVVLVFILTCVTACAQDALQIMTEVQQRSRTNSQHYEGTLQVIAQNNRVSEKRWVYDRVGAHGSSKALLKFTAPAEVKGVALLILNHPDRASDQWMWTPAINRERRIALQDRSTRFFGTDFTFEDLEERDVSQYDYRTIGEEAIGGAQCWKIESTPKQAKGSQYTHSYVWVRKDNYVVMRMEGYKRNKIVRSIAYSDIAKVQNTWTARRLEVLDPGRNSRTVLTLEQLQYNVPLKDEDFSLQALRRQS
jgi:outer membrane lipoprotein-sorting protein